MSQVAKSTVEQKEEFCDITRLLIQSKSMKDTIEKIYTSYEATMKQVNVDVTAENHRQTLFALKPERDKCKLLKEEKKAKEKCIANLVRDKYKLMLREKQVKENYEKTLDEEIQKMNEKISEMVKDVTDARVVAASSSKELYKMTYAPGSSENILKINKWKDDLAKTQGKTAGLKEKRIAIKNEDKEALKEVQLAEEEVKKLREEAKGLGIDLKSGQNLDKKIEDLKKKKEELLKDKEDFEKTANLWMTYLKKGIKSEVKSSQDLVAKAQDLDIELRRAQKKLRKLQELVKEIEKNRGEPKKLGMPQPTSRKTDKQIEYEKRMKAAREQTYTYRKFQSKYHTTDEMSPDTAAKHLLNDVMLFWNKIKRELTGVPVIESYWERVKRELTGFGGIDRYWTRAKEEVIGEEQVVDNFFRGMIGRCLRS